MHIIQDVNQSTLNPLAMQVHLTAKLLQPTQPVAASHTDCADTACSSDTEAAHVFR